jgi:hypothetical protein
MHLHLLLDLALADGGCSVVSVKKADPEAFAASDMVLYPAITERLPF